MNEKCKHCGKERRQHNAMTRACPVGARHRTVGHTAYHHTNVYTPKVKPLKFYNGRGYGEIAGRGSIYIAAYSRADAARLLKQAVGRGSVAQWDSEIKIFYSQCWGDAMKGITPERGLWASKDAYTVPEVVERVV